MSVMLSMFSLECFFFGNLFFFVLSMAPDHIAGITAEHHQTQKPKSTLLLLSINAQDCAACATVIKCSNM